MKKLTGNDEFLSVTGVAKSQLRGCMTVHNLIDSKYHPVLNDLFELALRGDTGDRDSPFMTSGKAAQLASAAAAPPLVVVASRETTAMSNDVARERQIAAAMAPPSSVSLERSISPRSDLSDDNDAVTTSCDVVGATEEKCTKEEEKGDAYYTSLTLPCVSFSRALSLQMTIVLMNDIDPSRRCFYCIMSPQEKMPEQAAAGVHRNLFNSFLLAQQGGGGGGQSMMRALPDATKAFVAETQTSNLGVIRRIDQDELASLL